MSKIFTTWLPIYKLDTFRKYHRISYLASITISSFYSKLFKIWLFFKLPSTNKRACSKIIGSIWSISVLNLIVSINTFSKLSPSPLSYQCMKYKHSHSPCYVARFNRIIHTMWSAVYLTFWRFQPVQFFYLLFKHLSMRFAFETNPLFYS